MIIIEYINFTLFYISQYTEAEKGNQQDFGGKGSEYHENHRNENDKKGSTETGKNLSRYKNEKSRQIV